MNLTGSDTFMKAPINIQELESIKKNVWQKYTYTRKCSKHQFEHTDFLDIA